MKPLIAAIAITVFAVNANAQMNSPVAIANSGSTQASALQTTVENANTMSFKEVATLARAAERTSIAQSIPTVVKKMVDEQGAGATELLRSGRELDMAVSAGTDLNPLQQRSVNVSVTYDARPVGGILNIRVELVPVFGGIGSAVRPVVSREFAQAVNDFDDDLIGQTIIQLTDELASEYASK
ncbi:MAG: hypothetical protein ACHQNE_04120 [Candidatus Kapaibacterium sp.]